MTNLTGTWLVKVKSAALKSFGFCLDRRAVRWESTPMEMSNEVLQWTLCTHWSSTPTTQHGPRLMPEGLGLVEVPSRGHVAPTGQRSLGLSGGPVWDRGEVTEGGSS